MRFLITVGTALSLLSIAAASQIPDVFGPQMSPALERRGLYGHMGEYRPNDNLPQIDGMRYGRAGIKMCAKNYEKYGYEFCNTPTDRKCWLRKKGAAVKAAPVVAGVATNGTGPVQAPDLPAYSIHTDLDRGIPPSGTVRQYRFIVREVPESINNIGGYRSNGKHFINNMFPGPTIEACWGDTIEITVENQMVFNGTTIHWHGMRLHNNAVDDGVSGISQCAIPPGESYTYRIVAEQHGGTWYHSHYSTQYLDGVLGGLMVYGPTSYDWDTDGGFIMINDWVPDNALSYFPRELSGHSVRSQRLLVNGKGPQLCDPDPKSDKYSGARCMPNFDRLRRGHASFKLENGKKTKFSIVNGSAATHLRFSIDNHKFWVIQADMVPIHPVLRNWIDIGIGQRYTIVVEGGKFLDRSSQGLSSAAREPNDSYWIRLRIPENAEGPTDHTEEVAFVTYSPKLYPPWPSYYLPVVKGEDDGIQGYIGPGMVVMDQNTGKAMKEDDPRFLLAPLPYFGDANTKLSAAEGLAKAPEQFVRGWLNSEPTVYHADELGIPFNEFHLEPVVPWNVASAPAQEQFTRLQIALTQGYFASREGGNRYRWSFSDRVFWMSDWFRNSWMQHFDPISQKTDAALGSADEDRRNRPTVRIEPLSNGIYDPNRGTQWVLIETNFTSPGHTLANTIHPVHLHGHDFAIVAEGNHPLNTHDNVMAQIQASELGGVRLNNPLRRDVAIVPPNGWVLIAFKMDNPGPWLFHCHIAMHASAGLAVAFLENPENPEVIRQNSDPRVRDMCSKMKGWIESPKGWQWKQDESGI